MTETFFRYDLGHLDYGHLKEMVKTRKSSGVILVYVACMIVHLCTAKIDDKIGMLAYNNSSVLNVSSVFKSFSFGFMVLFWFRLQRMKFTNGVAYLVGDHCWLFCRGLLLVSLLERICCTAISRAWNNLFPLIKKIFFICRLL